MSEKIEAVKSAILDAIKNSGIQEVSISFDSPDGSFKILKTPIAKP